MGSCIGGAAVAGPSVAPQLKCDLGERSYSSSLPPSPVPAPLPAGQSAVLRRSPLDPPLHYQVRLQLEKHGSVAGQELAEVGAVVGALDSPDLEDTVLLVVPPGEGPGPRYIRSRGRHVMGC